MSKYLTCAETAKMIRKALKKAFPGQKFSVRSNTYAGGASIDVSWVDGPTSDAVKEVTESFTGASFDGMIDLKSYHDSEITHEDGTKETVHHGADYVFTHRTPSEETKELVDAKFEAGERGDCVPSYHDDKPSQVRYLFGALDLYKEPTHA